MDLRLFLCQIAVKHGTEDGASHGQHILGEGGEGADASDTHNQNYSSLLSSTKEQEQFFSVALVQEHRQLAYAVRNTFNLTHRNQQYSVLMPSWCPQGFYVFIKGFKKSFSKR